MAMEEKRNGKPLLLKFGVALALSFASFIYARFKSRNFNPSLPLPSPSSSGRRRRTRSDYNQATKTPSSSNQVPIADDGHVDICTPKISVNGSVVDPTPSRKHGGDKHGFLPEFHDLVKELDFSIVDTSFSPKQEAEAPASHNETLEASVGDAKDEYEHEIRHLRNMASMLRERERSLEVRLLEYHGLEEQETAVMELRNRLKMTCAESKLLVVKIESLQADNGRLEAQVWDHGKVLSDLEAARAKIKILKKKLSSVAGRNKELILNLQKRVENLPECKSAEHFPDFQTKMKRVKDLDGEVEELRKFNSRLQLENSDLGRRLEATQLLANSVLEDSEAEAWKEENEQLRQEKDDLTKKVERLEANRCTDVEESVYLRWISACLRYELRNYKPPAGKTVARDLNVTLSPKSKEKAKQLILEYANTEGIVGKKMNISSVQASYLTDSSEADKNPSPEISGWIEDIEYPRCISAISIRNEADFESSSLRFKSLSKSLWRPPLDLRRCGKNSESSPSSSKRFELGGRSSGDPAMAACEELELMKYAVLFKDSRGHGGESKSHKKSASFGAF